VVGSYRGEPGGGISGHPSDSQSRLGHKEKESARASMQPNSSHPDPRGRGADTDFGVGSHPGGGIPGRPSDSQTRSGHKEKESARQQSSNLQDARFRGTDADYGTSGQGYRGEASGRASGAPTLAASSTQQPSERQPEYTTGGSNRTPYAERDNRGSTIPNATMGTTAHSSKSPPNPMTSIPQRKEEGRPPYNARGSGSGREGSNQPDPSRTTLHGAVPPTRPPPPEARYSHPSQVQGSLGSQRQENTWDGGLSRPSGGRDSSSNPSAGSTASHPWGGQPTGTPPGLSVHPPHRVSFSPSLHQNF
jgi:hypothetical protein